MIANKKPPVVLVIAGNDPSGGAGIAADIQAISANGAHPAPVITCLTVQDTQNAYEVECCDPDFVYRQAHRLFDDLPIAAVKIGLLAHAEIAAAVAELLESYKGPPVVLDPVLIAAGGARLAARDLKQVIIDRLCRLATVITPNAGEIRELAGLTDNDDTYETRAKKLLSFGSANVLAKGADEADFDPAQTSANEVTNTLYTGDGSVHKRSWPKLPHRYHGSGCTLAASLAALLANGMNVVDACDHAQKYTYESLTRGYRPGKGQHIPRRT